MSNTFYKVLKPRQICDVELLLNGGFSPLKGFLGQADYHSVLDNMRLCDGKLWPIPVNLTVNAEEAESIKKSEKVILTLADGLEVAELQVAEIYQPNLHKEAVKTFGVDDANHPYAKILHKRQGMLYIGGTLKKINDIPHQRFSELRHSPAELKRVFEKMNWKKVVAFQTRNPMHKSHYHLTLQALKQAGDDAHLLIHPVVGVTQDVDIDYDRTYALTAL